MALPGHQGPRPGSETTGSSQPEKSRPRHLHPGPIPDPGRGEQGLPCVRGSRDLRSCTQAWPEEDLQGTVHTKGSYCSLLPPPTPRLAAHGLFMNLDRMRNSSGGKHLSCRGCVLHSYLDLLAWLGLPQSVTQDAPRG